jgi:hypothetical protein
MDDRLRNLLMGLKARGLDAMAPKPPPKPERGPAQEVTHALSIMEPWLQAIVTGSKTVENRVWAPPDQFVGKPFALHGSKEVDREAIDWIEQNIGWRPEEEMFGRGQIVAVAMLDRVLAMPVDPKEVARLQAADPYLFGPYGLYLKDVTVLAEPVKAKGMLKFWALPEEIRGRVNTLYAAAWSKAA